MSSLFDVSILITTFLRDGYLFECLNRIKNNLPECRVLVVDDGDPSDKKSVLASQMTYELLPFDSGLSAKRNAGVRLCKTKYLLMGCDDFDFSTVEARVGVLKLIEVLDEFSVLDVASGRFNNYAYEGFLEYKPGEYIRQRWLRERPPIFYGTARGCDITVNYFLMRIDGLRGLPWDDRMKIGGEHGEWFLSLKEAGKKVAWVPGVNITALYFGEAFQDPRYCSYRDRAMNLGHRIFKEKRGIKNFIGFNGEII
jgi:glycosyltransferase involved in cell wall biosynthesis